MASILRFFIFFCLWIIEIVISSLFLKDWTLDRSHLNLAYFLYVTFIIHRNILWWWIIIMFSNYKLYINLNIWNSISLSKRAAILYFFNSNIYSLYVHIFVLISLVNGVVYANTPKREGVDCSFISIV